MLETAKARMQIYVAVDTLEYLQKGGRISRTAAAIGTVMNIKPVLKFDIGPNGLGIDCSCRPERLTPPFSSGI